jgi:sporulation protein YlmC with PRC-barrel domain
MKKAIGHGIHRFNLIGTVLMTLRARCEMEIPLNAQVKCSDGFCGRSEYVIIDPLSDDITHLVIRETPSSREYIVQVKDVSETIEGTIQLRCSKAELEKMKPFVKTTFIEELVPERFYSYDGSMYGMGTYTFMPYIMPGMKMKVLVIKQQIPPGEVALRRGSRVEATDGVVGHIDEFIIDPKHGHITHLVVREGHLRRQKEVIIPLLALKKVRRDVVVLRLSKHQIESLPTFPLRWHLTGL